jgi:hypothetical protein
MRCNRNLLVWGCGASKSMSPLHAIIVEYWHVQTRKLQLLAGMCRCGSHLSGVGEHEEMGWSYQNTGLAGCECLCERPAGLMYPVQPRRCKHGEWRNANAIATT